MQSKLNKWKHTGDKDFFPEFGHTTKVPYVSVEEPTKGWVFSNPFPHPNRPQRSRSGLLTTFAQRAGNTNFSEVLTSCDLPRATPSRLGAQAPRVTSESKVLPYSSIAQDRVQGFGGLSQLITH